MPRPSRFPLYNHRYTDTERYEYEDRLYELIIHRKEILIPKV